MGEPSDAIDCHWCRHALASHSDSYEWREDVNMRVCTVRGCDCRLFWETDDDPPDGAPAGHGGARHP